jgi:nicotinate-nucleotide pyrophosphorylase (carboxylating)
MTETFELSAFLIRPLVEAALREDMRSSDITTQTIIPAEQQATAFIRAREGGIFCGVETARLAFQLLDEAVAVEVLLKDGASLQPGDTVFKITGNARAILTGERIALNFAQRLSGIATLTGQFVAATEGTRARIADTRKTTPGLRVLEKYAVRCGGGSNHRFALDDLILIKDNHIELCGGITAAVDRARAHIGHAVKIEVECDTLEQVHEAVAVRADIILLDNMGPDLLREAVAVVNGRALCEASGGVNLGTVAAIAQSGVDIISVGVLTHGYKSLDLGLDIKFE